MVGFYSQKFCWHCLKQKLCTVVPCYFKLFPSNPEGIIEKWLRNIRRRKILRWGGISKTIQVYLASQINFFFLHFRLEVTTVSTVLYYSLVWRRRDRHAKFWLTYIIFIIYNKYLSFILFINSKRRKTFLFYSKKILSAFLACFNGYENSMVVSIVQSWGKTWRIFIWKNFHKFWIYKIPHLWQ